MERLKASFPILFGAVILMIPAIWNGYPIVYSDTSTYLASGFIPETPFDRPITYGLLIRIFSLNGLSLWLVTFFQALLLSFFLVRIARRLLHSVRKDRYAVFGILVAGILSTASWYASLLIADIYTSIAFLAAVDILTDDRSLKKKVFSLLVYFLAVATHLGHVSQFLAFDVFILLVAPLLFGYRRKLNQVRWELLLLIGLTAGSIALMGSALAKSKHAFLLGAMLENGVLDVVLEGECENQHWELCQYREQLPDRAWKFLWEDDSPFYAMGSFAGTRDEFNEIISVSLSKPEYITEHITASLRAGGRQLTQFGVADGNGAFGEGTSLHERMSAYLPGEIGQFEESRQARGELTELPLINRLFLWVVVACLPLLVLFLLRRTSLDPGLRSLIAMVLIFIVVNAWVNGTFANAIPRLGGKVIWLLPWVTFIAGVSLLRLRTERSNTNISESNHHG